MNKKSILIIDDSPIIRNMLADVFSDEGYVVETAENGAKGLNAALESDFDIIISDVHMPDKNGFEVVQGLLAKKPNSKIIITDSFPDKLAKCATDEGALCCLQKPFDLDEIRNKVKDIVEGRIKRIE